jgi:hypothetical protein
MGTDFANLKFQSGWNEVLVGELAQDRRLIIEYDLERLPDCRLNWRGAEVWDIEVYIRFHPREHLYNGSMLEKIRVPPGYGMVVELVPKPFEVRVPLDAERVELWFHNFFVYSVGDRHCSAWDSRFGQNYWYNVSRRGPTQPVSYRTGAIPSLEMVNVFAVSVSKRNVFPQPSTGPRGGTDLQTQLQLKAWVRNVAYVKNVWIDVHVFDGADTLIHSETLTLRYLKPAGGNGDFFSFDGKIYQGSVATPGSVSPRPDARKVQFRLYYEVNNQVFTDAILHQHELPEDAVTR